MTPMNDREYEWLKNIDERVDKLEDLPTKMELMTQAFNRMSLLLAGAIGTVIAAAIMIILFGRPGPG